VTPRATQAKILDRGTLLSRFGPPRTESVVFTNGVFDVMHRGHATYLERARALGDRLVVGVNSDASARRLGKGPTRPVNTEADRAWVVAALEVVDAVCVFQEDTPESLISELLPDVLVKGGDYTLDRVAGRAAVEASGGRVELIPFVEGYSTTAIIERIKGVQP
jgi:rfaE bifunctional protein nucleotidyltransferase chain/domain